MLSSLQNIVHLGELITAGAACRNWPVGNIFGGEPLSS